MTKRQAPQGHHGTDIFENRAREFGTQIQETPMADGRTPRGRFGYGKGRIEDSINVEGKSKGKRS